MERTSPYAALYFVALMTFGNYVLFNLLVAILVEGFSQEVSLIYQKIKYKFVVSFKHVYQQDDKKKSNDSSENEEEVKQEKLIYFYGPKDNLEKGIVKREYTVVFSCKLNYMTRSDFFLLK